MTEDGVASVKSNQRADRPPLALNPRRYRLLRRYGVALRSILMFACAAAAMLGAAVVLDPAKLLAVSPTTRQAWVATDANKEFIASLASLIDDSVEVLAVHQRGPSPYAECVVWLNDYANPGTIDADELAVISHSSVLRAVTVYSLSPSASALAAGGTSGGGVDPLSRGVVPILDRQSLIQPAFCDRWRALPVVRPRVIAQGISDMRMELVEATGGSTGAGEAAGDSGRPSRAGSRAIPDMPGLPGLRGVQDGGDDADGEGGGTLSLLRLSLEWESDSTDGPSDATALIDIGRRRRGTQE